MTIIRANTRFALQRITMIPWMGFGITIASSKTNAGEMVRDGPPASGGHSPQRVQPHFAVHQVSEQALLLPGAYRHETRARLAMVGARRAVPVHEADGAPMVFVSQPSFNPLDPPVLGEEHKSWGHPRPRQEESCTAFETSSGIAPYFSSRMVVLVGGWVKRRLGRRGLALHTVREQSMMACL